MKLFIDYCKHCKPHLVQNIQQFRNAYLKAALRVGQEDM